MQINILKDMTLIFTDKTMKFKDKIMKSILEEEYEVPEVQFVEVTVEKGFLISGIIVNDRYGRQVEKHVVDEVETW